MEPAPLPMLERAAHSAAKMERLFARPWLANLVLRRLIGPRLIDGEPGWARGIRTGLMKMGGPAMPAEALPAMARAVGATREMHESVLRAHAKGEPIAWVTWPVPSSIVAAFRLAVFVPENFYSIATASGGDGSTRMCEVADRHGIPAEMCSINRCMLGAQLDGQLPKPSLCITANHPCDGNHAGNAILRELAACDHFSVGGAYDRSPETVALWARSAFELIAFLEKRLGRPIDWDLLRGFGENLNRANRALNRVTELHRATPAPGMINCLSVYWRVVVGSGYMPQVAEGAELLAQAAEKLVARARERKAPRERLRVVLGDQAIAWTDFAAWLQREYQGTVVCDYIGHFCHPEIDTSSRESLVEGLVRDRLYMSMVRQAHGTMEYSLDELQTALREYDADCVVFHGNVGCKHNLALRREIEELCRAAKVPACFLEADIVDRRIVDEGPLREKLRAFFAAEGLPR